MLSRHLPILAPLLVCVLLGHNGSLVLAADTATPSASRPAIRGILFNEDDSTPFGYPVGTVEPGQYLDGAVDKLADSQVTIMLINCNSQKTNYDSKVWDIICKGFDPGKDDSQPYFGDLPRKTAADLEGLKWRRQWAQNARAALDAGVDPVQRMIDRCRKRGISPWVSVRMNDMHDAQLLKSPIHSRFWMEHPEYWCNDRITTGRNWYRSLNYGLKPVRDNMMALLREVCDRFDMDGLELDWNRWPSHFREGEEIEQGKALTEWLVEVREVVRAAEKKWKHPIYLAARVPARPEVSMGTGLDAVAWAKRGLIDHLIVAPFFFTTDYDIPVEQWNELLKGTGVGVTVGLENCVRAHGFDPTNQMVSTPEQRRGAAIAALARGSQGIYLFNYMEVQFDEKRNHLFKELGSVDTLIGKDRSYVVTYVDITIPGKPIPPSYHPLPKKLAPGESAKFSLFIGPKPLASARGEVKLKLTPEKPEEECVAGVAINGQSPAAGDGFTFSSGAFREGYNTIRVANAGKAAMTIHALELSLRFPQR
jgi:hypothetical protein